MPDQQVVPDETRASRALDRWQAKLRAWIQYLMTILVFIFLAHSAWQINRIMRHLDQAPILQLGEMPDLKAPFDSRMLYCLASLESYTVQQRYHQANVALLSRTWTKYLGFITGMILAVIGASFILGKLKEDKVELSSKLEAWQISLISTSPGLVMVVLGSILMMTAILEHQKILVEDRPLYLRMAVKQTSSNVNAVDSSNHSAFSLLSPDDFIEVDRSADSIQVVDSHRQKKTAGQAEALADSCQGKKE